MSNCLPEPILFAEWLAKNHYVLCNETKGYCYWSNENHKNINTSKLYLYFLKQRCI